ncbi:cell wall hydrolase [Sphingomonas sediminicola]|uniref:Cell wall hydrolase n=1 Tax=Sphingomonas sediminicola TaxID=386874 RepID=A0ABX6TAV7_9SPHN|nr:cell wall hydrolase [Sphingomonas sediminicola]
MSAAPGKTDDQLRRIDQAQNERPVAVDRQYKEKDLKRFLVGRGLTAVAGLFLVAASNSATAAPLSAGTIDAAAKPLGAVTQVVRSAASSLSTATTAVVSTVSGGVIQARPATAVTMSLAPSINREAAWLYQNGWPLYALVDRYSTGAPLDEEATCLATAVYFEARGESVEGQLAVARVVMNRAASGRYPSSWCATVKQPWQFSFVRNGQFPYVDSDCDAWRKAQGIARLAMSNAVPSVSNDVLWYHANYVAPSWGRRLTRVSQIGAHIFYRA